MGLLKTGLKAVVAVKTADVIHQRILDRQAAQWGPYGPPPGHGAPGPYHAAAAPQPAGGGVTGYAAPAGGPPPGPSGVIDQLERLGQLRASGVLTDAEFEAQKYRVLAG